MPLRKYDLRFSLVFLSIIALLLTFSLKLILIQIFRSDHLASLAEKQHNYSIDIEPIRGKILDRNFRPLALNVAVYSLYANPRMMSDVDKQNALKILPEILDVSEDYLQKLLNKDKFFVWIKRKLPTDLTAQVEGLNLKGLNFIQESKRFYPNNALAAHVVGFAGMDNDGLEGIERLYDKRLKGEPGKAYILRDARQKELLVEKSYIAPRNGYDVVLTIDETIQFIAEKALDEAYTKYKAIGGSIVVMDVQTGEILALANRPTYDLSDFSRSETASRVNRAVNYILEPGSVFKIVTASAALEEDAYKETDEIFCENGEYRIANHILHDHKPHGKLSFKDVFRLSSNIGTAKIAQKLTPAVIYKYADKFRFGKKTEVDLIGEVPGLLKHPAKWSKTTISAIPMGHEVTVTPLQLVCAIAAVANDGLYIQPHIVKLIQDEHGQVIHQKRPQIVDRVISSETASRVKDILVSVVESGTGRNAQIEGMRVAGKTGTAQKVVDGKYSHSQFNATFMGFAPADNPKLAVVVVLDDPQPQYFGGTVSAPVFQTVVSNSLRYLANAESQPNNRTKSLAHLY